MESPTSTGHNISEILQAFAGLSEDAQTVGYASAWLLEPLNQTKVMERLVSAGFTTYSGKRFMPPVVKEALQDLAQAKVIKLVEGRGYEVDVIVSHHLVAALADDPVEFARYLRLPLHDRYSSSYGKYNNPYVYGRDEARLRAIRDLRLAFYVGDQVVLNRTLRNIEAALPGLPVWEFLFHPFRPARLRALPAEFLAPALEASLYAAADVLVARPGLLEIACERGSSPVELQIAGEMALLQGNRDLFWEVMGKLARLATPASALSELQLRAAEAFLRGEDDQAIADFEASMAAWRKVTRKKKACPPDYCGIWFLCALLRRGKPGDLGEVRQYAKVAQTLQPPGRLEIFIVLEKLAEILSGTPVDTIWPGWKVTHETWRATVHPRGIALFVALTGRFVMPDEKAFAPLLNRLLERAIQAENWWIAAEAASLLAQWGSGKEEVAETCWQRLGVVPPQPFSTRLIPIEPWERLLTSLESLALEKAPKGPATSKSTEPAGKQLIWLLEVYGERWRLSPIERTITGKGKVSKGRAVALKRLQAEAEQMTHLTEQDRLVVKWIHRTYSWDGRGDYSIEDSGALLALAGHPSIVADTETLEPIELIKTLPRLICTASRAGEIKVALAPVTDYETCGARLVLDSPGRYLVVDVRETHVRLCKALGGISAKFPAQSKERVSKALGALSGEVMIEADDGTVAAGAMEVENVTADATPVIRLWPHGSGLQVRTMVRPVPGSELTFPPGSGRAIVLAPQLGRQLRAKRNLREERERAEAVLAAACPEWSGGEGDSPDQWAFVLDDPADCLDFLLELQAQPEGAALIEWPEGESYKIRAVADASQFELSLGGSAEWLTASGSLRVDGDLVLTMRQLLNLTAEAGATPGFVRLEDGQFLALTREFRRQLDDLRAFSQPGKGDELKIHPLAVEALDDFVRATKAKPGVVWKKQLEKLREAPKLELTEPPSTLQAELRPYQLEGFRWLLRFSHWGFGACLADDMGLGKTVQALALLLERAKDGPALVVAPTSVAANWLEETQRFAPALNPILFGRGPEDRQAVLASARPFDLVIASYGLLYSEVEAFAAVSWNTVILDEAQAIKNRATKRSQAAMSLQSSFRLITTGTPVENRLGELHTLFSFINPGFLGSWDHFRTHFADPIERHNDRDARDRLRRLIRPFVLRRLKSAVLRDLPPRTEIPLHVELSAEEAAFYEALRQRAVENVAKAAEESAQPGQAAFRILAELTRLRRACCHPKLIDPETVLPGSKLRVFAETLEEILAGRHKVLVFSQFVDHLAIVRQHLETEKISYQYLDGSTPAAKRQEAVRDFQAGAGDVFLISLKAGGFGLNLTAADYVIHLDPWWNPAAEDQASDRAHRIGQQRPVTIYRLITTGTIEDKIVDLHHRKRELADSLLDGTDSAGRLTPEEMLELLRG